LSLSTVTTLAAARNLPPPASELGSKLARIRLTT
jgi:hypothetical protein